MDTMSGAEDGSGTVLTAFVGWGTAIGHTAAENGVKAMVFIGANARTGNGS